MACTSCRVTLFVMSLLITIFAPDEYTVYGLTSHVVSQTHAPQKKNIYCKRHLSEANRYTKLIGIGSYNIIVIGQVHSPLG